MIVHRAMALGALLALGGCAATGPLPPSLVPPGPLSSGPAAASLFAPDLVPGQVAADLELAVIAERTERAVDRAFREAPFAGGPLAVVTREGGRLRAYGLVPCEGGTTVCAGDAHGPRGTVALTPDHLVVSGLYGRRFYLSWGGDGVVERDGRFAPLAWDARANGPSPGADPILETTRPHS